MLQKPYEIHERYKVFFCLTNYLGLEVVDEVVGSLFLKRFLFVVATTSALPAEIRMGFVLLGIAHLGWFRWMLQPPKTNIRLMVQKSGINSPVVMVNIPLFFKGFIHPNCLFAISEASTVAPETQGLVHMSFLLGFGLLAGAVLVFGSVRFEAIELP